MKGRVGYSGGEKKGRVGTVEERMESWVEWRREWRVGYSGGENGELSTVEERRSIKLRVERGTGRGGREESRQTMALCELRRHYTH